MEKNRFFQNSRLEYPLKWLLSYKTLNIQLILYAYAHKSVRFTTASTKKQNSLTIEFLRQDAIQKYRNTINKGVEYIVRNIEGLDDLYALSLSTYVLNLARHQYEDVAFGRLDAKATTKDDLKWWSKPVPDTDKNPWLGSLPRSVDVEMTSYAMMTLLRRNLVTDAIPVMKWLVRQRNTEGGFSSTQDTVVGIYALSKLGERLLSKDNNIAITFTYEGGGQSQMNINSANAMILQKHGVRICSKFFWVENFFCFVLSNL